MVSTGVDGVYRCRWCLHALFEVWMVSTRFVCVDRCLSGFSLKLDRYLDPPSRQVESQTEDYM